jgi:lysozyme family protein
MDFDEAFTKLLGHEGGYSDNPRDPGGKTMWGVTEAVARAHGYRGDMRDLTQEFAKFVYNKSYWSPVRADEMPDAIRFDLFDTGVNSGPSRAIKLLQEAVGTVPDGSIGPRTMAAINHTAGGVLAARFNGRRLMFMTGLSNWPDASKGWARRVAKNLMDA